jgi:hypothetical protein
MGRVIRPFGRLRRRRHDSEYPTDPADAIDADEVRDALADVATIVEFAARVIDELEPF